MSLLAALGNICTIPGVGYVIADRLVPPVAG
jgi:hypothetical protein